MSDPVTTKELQVVMERMAKLLNVKFEEHVSGKNSGPVLEQSQVVQKIELLPNDVKLEGTRNYLSWSRRALLNLQMKGLEGYVNGECSEPVDKSGVVDKMSVEWIR